MRSESEVLPAFENVNHDKTSGVVSRAQSPLVQMQNFLRNLLRCGLDAFSGQRRSRQSGLAPLLVDGYFAEHRSHSTFVAAPSHSTTTHR